MDRSCKAAVASSIVLMIGEGTIAAINPRSVLELGLSLTGLAFAAMASIYLVGTACAVHHAVTMQMAKHARRKELQRAARLELERLLQEDRARRLLDEARARAGQNGYRT